MCDRGIQIKTGSPVGAGLPVVVSNHKPLSFSSGGQLMGTPLVASLGTGCDCCLPIAWVETPRACDLPAHGLFPEGRKSKGGAYDYAYSPGSRAFRLRP